MHTASQEPHVFANVAVLHAKESYLRRKRHSARGLFGRLVLNKPLQPPLHNALDLLRARCPDLAAPRRAGPPGRRLGEGGAERVAHLARAGPKGSFQHVCVEPFRALRLCRGVCLGAEDGLKNRLGSFGRGRAWERQLRFSILAQEMQLPSRKGGGVLAVPNGPRLDEVLVPGQLASRKGLHAQR